MRSNSTTTLFIFAHQDDEVAFFYEIERAIKHGKNAVCVYLTNGEWKKTKAATRNEESYSALKHLGMKKENIFFLGDRTKIKSGELPKKASIASAELLLLFKTLSNVTQLFTFAYEGGHEDHDATFWISCHLALQNNLVEASHCVPFYRASDSKWLSFTVFDPLPENGEIKIEKLTWKLRLKYIALSFFYPSQAITFLGLGPFILRQYLLRGQQYLQKMDACRVKSVPHRKILYEQRNRYDYRSFKKQLDEQIPL
jgi:hypothetical protein